VLCVSKDTVNNIEAAQADAAVGYVDAMRRVYPELNPKCLPLGDGGYAVYAGKNSPLNRALGPALKPCGLQDVHQFYEAYGEKPQVDVYAFSDNSLLEALGDNRYCIRWFLNSYIKRLDTGLAAVSGSLPVETSQTNCESAWTWALTVEEGFSGVMSDELKHPSIAYVNTQNPSVRCFLATIDSEPVGGAALEVRRGIGLLFSASTCKEHRGLGVHAELIQVKLRAAKSLGCDIAVCMAAPGSESERNLVRAGFCMAYTRIRMQRRQ